MRSGPRKSQSLLVQRSHERESRRALSVGRSSSTEGRRPGRPSGVEDLFATLVGRIETAYERLGHQLGWRFLYSPARTLDPKTRLATVGANPGGRRYDPPSPSVEEGNAYRTESWPGGGARGLNPLQSQIGLLYDALAARLPRTSADELMDDTLASNFCPFRSPSWDLLANRTESIAFSRDLWKDILGFVTPSAIVCLGDRPARELGSTLVSSGWRLSGRPEIGQVGWGDVSYELAYYDSAGARSLLVRLPHLSRFGIFGRPASKEAADRLASLIAATLGGNPQPLQPDAALKTPSPVKPARPAVGRPTGTGAGVPPLVPHLPSREEQAAAQRRGEPIIVSCSARRALGGDITWIALEPDGTYRVDGPAEHGFPVSALSTFPMALVFARSGVPPSLQGDSPDPASP